MGYHLTLAKIRFDLLGIKSCVGFFIGLLLVFNTSARTVPDANNPGGFFTTVADKLLRNTFDFGITNIPVFSYGIYVYTPAVQRILQLSANVLDASTTNYYPTVFRPVFYRDGDGNVFITGYQQVVSVSGVVDSQLEAPIDVAALPIGFSSSKNVYGVPWIIGAKKGFPSFNQYYMRSTVQLTRRLQVIRQDGQVPGATGTNQMFTMSITNRLGFSFWNAYNTNYVSTNGLSIFVRDVVKMVLTNSARSWPSFYSGPPVVQFATNINLGNTWPGSSWSSSGLSPENQYPASQSFVSGYWDFGFLPQSDFQASINDFVLAGNGTWDPNISDGNLPALPQFGLLTTNWLQAFILDGNHVIDYVQLKGPNSSRNLGNEIMDDPSIINSYAMWDTNGYINAPTVAKGVVNQIFVSMNNPSGTIATFWMRPPNMPAALNAPAAEASYFKGFFYGNATVYNGKVYPNTNLVMRAPYTPTRTAWEYTSWQANDPLVHYLASDLNTITRLTGIHHADVLANSDYPTPNLNTICDRYQPWGRNLLMNQLSNVDKDQYDLDYRDPLVWNSDAWDFPGNQGLALTSLGRIHRGTPWQTIYLKRPDVLQSVVNFGSSQVYVGTNTWMQWTGDQDANDAVFMAPIHDRELLGVLLPLLNTNDPTQLLSVNASALTDWTNRLDGLNVLTNSTPFPASYITPQLDAVIMSGSSPQAALIGNAILQTKTGQPNQHFQFLGDILATPALTDGSPWLDTSATGQIDYGISDAAYEAIPSQLLPLLRPDSFGGMIQSNGNWSLQFSGSDAFSYVLQASGDLVHWNNLGTNSAVRGYFSIPAVPPPDSLKQFYRSVLLP